MSELHPVIENRLNALILISGCRYETARWLRSVFRRSPELADAVMEALFDLCSVQLSVEDGLLLLSRIARMRLRTEMCDSRHGELGKRADQLPVWVIREIEHHDQTGVWNLST